MNCTYILYSKMFDRFYIGQCQNMEERLGRHNRGSEKATAPYAPWTIVLVLSKPSRAEAMVLEQKLKNLNRLRLQAFIDKYTAQQ